MAEIILPFEHRQSAHCETGVISNLMRFHGLQISEPMAFGIGRGLFFSHFPFLKVNGLPVTSYRILPGNIFKNVTSRLNISMVRQTFSTPEKAMNELDRVLESGLPAGMMTSVFYLPYLPRAFRFHFNGHNIVIFGRQGDEYLVSDPVMETTTTIHRTALIRARFAKGLPPTKGRMYYPTKVPKDVDLRPAVSKSLRKNAYDMHTIPVPIFGYKAINYLGSKVRNYEKEYGPRKAVLYLGNIVRMQEEIGTGGGGFRFMYAAFLQEAAKLLDRPELREHAKMMTDIGDQWRDFAYDAGRICKGRAPEGVTYATLADLLTEIAESERKVFEAIYKCKP